MLFTLCLRVCVCLYANVRGYVCVCVLVYIIVHARIIVYVIYVYLHTYACVCVRVREYVYDMYVCVRVREYVYDVYVCIGQFSATIDRQEVRRHMYAIFEVLGYVGPNTVFVGTR